VHGDADTADWARLETQAGTAERFPDLLRSLAGADPRAAAAAARDLDDALVPADGSLCPAAVAVLPFLRGGRGGRAGPAPGPVRRRS
jgi:hypothetical protein